MKTFTYTCRDRAGALQHDSLQASDRADALRLIKDMGCIPVSVTERSAKGKISKPFSTLLTPRAVGLAGVVIVLIVGLFVLRLLPKKSEPKSRTAEVRNQTVTNEPTKSPRTVTKAIADNDKMPVVRADTEVIRAQPQAAKPQARVIAPKTFEQPAEKESEDIATEPAFKTLTEQLISMLGRPGEELPPLPLSVDEDLEKDFEKAATNLIPVSETDDERTFAHKANVAQEKEYIKEAKKMGWTPGDYLRELEKKRKEEVAERKAALEILTEVEETSPKEVSTALKELNKSLQEKGILPIDSPTQD